MFKRERQKIYLLMLLILTGCTPPAEVNVLAYLFSERMGTFDQMQAEQATGALTGLVLHDVQPLANATVIIAERDGTPHVAQTGWDGRYRIEDLPIGSYVPAATAPGYTEGVAQSWFGTANVTKVEENQVVEAWPITLIAHVPPPLPHNLAKVVQLQPIEEEQIGTHTAAAPYPPDSEAQVQAFRFTRDGVTVDTLRLYLPVDAPTDEPLPLLFMIYPSPVDRWETVSVAFAAQNYALVAISPSADWGMDVDAHAQDARIALALAQSGALSSRIDEESKAIVLGGSFSSAIAGRLLQDAHENVLAWITVGGISNAFTGTAAFYADEIFVPPPYDLAIPALGVPNVFPLPFLRYSPVYRAAELPPTLIIHTAADTIIPIDQAYELEDALRKSGVPVEVFYYEDVSHYLQIGDDLTEAGTEMFWQILDFIDKAQE